MLNLKNNLGIKTFLILVVLTVFVFSLIFIGYKAWDKTALTKNVATNLSLYNENTIKVNQLAIDINTLGKNSLNDKNYDSYLSELQTYQSQVNTLSLNTNQLKTQLTATNNPKSSKIVSSISDTLSSQVSLLSSYSQSLLVINCVVSVDQKIYQNGSKISDGWSKVSVDTTTSQLQDLVKSTQNNLQDNINQFDNYQKCFTNAKYYTKDIISELDIEKKYIQSFLASLKKVVTSLDTQKKADFDTGINEIVGILKGQSQYQKYLKQSTLQNVEDLTKVTINDYKYYQDALNNTVNSL
jgi:hypothetical protein